MPGKKSPQAVKEPLAEYAAREYLSAVEAAQYAGITVRDLHRLVRTGREWAPLEIWHQKSDVTGTVQPLVDLDLRVIPGTRGLLQRAVAFAFRGNISVYDALFIACAAQEKVSPGTADADLVRLFGDLFCSGPPRQRAEFLMLTDEQITEHSGGRGWSG